MILIIESIFKFQYSSQRKENKYSKQWRQLCYFMAKLSYSVFWSSKAQYYEPRTLACFNTSLRECLLHHSHLNNAQEINRFEKSLHLHSDYSNLLNLLFHQNIPVTAFIVLLLLSRATTLNNISIFLHVLQAYNVYSGTSLNLFIMLQIYRSPLQVKREQQAKLNFNTCHTKYLCSEYTSPRIQEKKKQYFENAKAFAKYFCYLMLNLSFKIYMP